MGAGTLRAAFPMMDPAPTPWQLFVDESGPFHRWGEGVVAGVLLRGADSPELSQALRRAIEEELPFVAWPPHATDLRVPVMHVVSWVRFHGGAGGIARSSPNAREDGLSLMAAAEEIEQFSAKLGARLRGVARTTDSSFRPALEALDASVRAQLPALHRRLQSLAESRRARMRVLLGQLGGIAEEDGAFLVLAGAGDGPLEPLPGTGGEPGDHYSSVLTALFERVAALLALGDAEAHVDCQVATRDVAANAAIGGAMVEALGTRAAGRWPGARGVKFSARAPIVRYDGGVHPGVVFADFVANSTLHSLSAGVGCGLGLGEATHQIRERCGLATSPPPSLLGANLAGGYLPPLCAPGLAADRVRAAWSGRKGPAPDMIRLLWSREQSDRWVGAAAEGAAP
jgi:hypothetical protein